MHYQGNLGAKGWGFPKKGEYGQPHFSSQWGGEADITLSLAPKVPLELRAHPRFNYDPERTGYRPFRFDDLYLDYFARFFEIRAGYQVFSWKTVEGISQADILNQTDRGEDFFDAPKIGEPAVRTRFILPWAGEQVLELYYLPYFTPAPLPGRESRYNLFQGTPHSLSQSEDDYRFISRDKRWRPQGAARVQTRPLESLDFALYYFHGYRRFPLFTPLDPDKDTLVFSHVYSPVYQAGFTFQGAFGSWLLKGETAYLRYEEDVFSLAGNKVEPYLAYTTGFEYTIYSPFIANQDLGAIVEWIGDSDAGKNVDELDGFRPFRNHVFGGLRYTFNTVSDRSLLAGLFADYYEGDLIYRLEYKERFFRSFSARVEVSGIEAREKSQFQSFTRAARMATELKYHF